MQSRRDRLLLEVSLQVRSAWALASIVVLLSGLALGSMSSLNSARAMSHALLAMQRSEGSGFSQWLAHDPQAAPFRDELGNVQPHMGADLYLTIFGAIGPLLAVVWGSRVVGSEFSGRTVRLRAAQDGWAHAVAVKQIVMGAVIVIAAIAVPLLGFAAGRVVWQVLSREMPAVSSLSAPAKAYSPVLGALVVAAGVLLYGLLASSIALLTRSVAAGIVVGLAIPFGESLIQRWWLPQTCYSYLLRKVLVYNETSLVGAPAVARPPSSTLLACGVMGAWLAALVLGSRLLAGRQEIS